MDGADYIKNWRFSILEEVKVEGTCSFQVHHKSDKNHPTFLSSTRHISMTQGTTTSQAEP
jgi:hypothetical protein